jgi:hypothetical protein
MRLNPELDTNKLDEYSRSNDIPKLHYQGNFSDFFILGLSVKDQDLVLRTCNIYNK